MANSWFRFKQFTVHQDRCAMKVGTDGALLGALAPVPLMGKILDIGTGTGVVALMLAQRSDVGIDAVEVDEGAARQAAENIRDSPWSDRIQVIHADFRDFCQSWKNRYDVIVSNPPYFRHSLRSELPEKALARHAEEDFHKDLLAGSVLLLSPSGRCCFILPPEGAALMEVVAHEMGMVVRSRVDVYSKAGGKLIRQVITLERNDAGTHRDVGPETDSCMRGLHPSGQFSSGAYTFPALAERQLVIYENNGEYTMEFRELMRSFYLNI